MQDLVKLSFGPVGSGRYLKSKKVIIFGYFLHMYWSPHKKGTNAMQDFREKQSNTNLKKIPQVHRYFSDTYLRCRGPKLTFSGPADLIDQVIRLKAVLPYKKWS